MLCLCACDGEPTASDLAEWEVLEPLLVASRAPAIATDGIEIFVVGGTGVAGRLNQLQVFDIASGRWRTGTPIPVAVDWASAAVVGRQLHLFGGVTASAAATAEHWIYAIGSNAWTAGPSLPEPSAGSAIALVGDELFLAGGINGPSAHSDHLLIYKPSVGTWRQGSPVPGSRIKWAGGASNRIVYGVGGQTPGLGTTDEFLSYDVGGDSWSQLASIPQGREAHGSAVVNGRFCTAGGRIAASGNFNTPFADLMCYHSDEARWVAKLAMPRALQELQAVGIGDQLYLIGGRDAQGAPVSDVRRIRID